MPPDDRYWSHLDRLVERSRIVIDRPKGSTHPRFPAFVYPYDYGYLEGTHAMDGGGVDAWVGSLPGRRVTAVIATVDLEKGDAEIKILVGCTPDEARKILITHNEGPQAGLLIERME